MRLNALKIELKNKLEEKLKLTQEITILSQLMRVDSYIFNIFNGKIGYFESYYPR